MKLMDNAYPPVTASDWRNRVMREIELRASLCDLDVSPSSLRFNKQKDSAIERKS
jgi:hypothetical protein